jgi:hypothetical protein
VPTRLPLVIVPDATGNYAERVGSWIGNENAHLWKWGAPDGLVTWICWLTVEVALGKQQGLRWKRQGGIFGQRALPDVIRTESTIMPWPGWAGHRDLGASAGFFCIFHLTKPGAHGSL